MPPTLNLADGIDGLRGAWLYGLDSSPPLNEEIEQISGRWAWSRRGRGIGWRRNVCADDRPLMRHLSAMVTCCLRDEWSAARPSYSCGMRTRVFLMRWRFQVGLNDNSVEKVIIDCIPHLVNGGRGSWETCQLTNIIRTLLWSFNIYSINFVKLVESHGWSLSNQSWWSWSTWHSSHFVYLSYFHIFGKKNIFFIARRKINFRPMRDLNPRP